METVILALQIIAASAFLSATFYFLNRRLVAFYTSRPHLKFRRQLIQIFGVLISILFVILFMPFGDVLRGQLLRLYGLVFSATIALSSTTLVSNIMAGLMLKMIGSCKPGRHITVGDYVGRISEMDLLHTEIQTEERDLTTLPNLYLVTHPVRVIRSSGTILSVEVSLGYDVSRHAIEALLIGAAADTELEKPYVQIRELGDFAVTYRISALLTDVGQIIDKRRELRARTMDALHGADIEIVSPTFMNTRSIAKDKTFVAEVNDQVDDDSSTAVQAESPDSIAFDKAEQAESVSKLHDKVEEAETRLKICSDVISDAPNDQAVEAATVEKESLQRRVERLGKLIEYKESKISKDE